MIQAFNCASINPTQVNKIKARKQKKKYLLLGQIWFSKILMFTLVDPSFIIKTANLVKCYLYVTQC